LVYCVGALPSQHIRRTHQQSFLNSSVSPSMISIIFKIFKKTPKFISITCICLWFHFIWSNLRVMLLGLPWMFFVFLSSWFFYADLFLAKIFVSFLIWFVLSFNFNFGLLFGQTSVFGLVYSSTKNFELTRSSQNRVKKVMALFDLHCFDTRNFC
jgi:hypothetical protein